MTSFFEKLKKGMEIEESSDNEMESKPKKDLALESEEKDFLEKIEKPRKRKAERKKKKSPKKKDKTEKKETMRKRKRIKIKEEKEKKLPVSDKGEEQKDKKWFEEEGELAVDIYQTSDDIVIQSAIAGVTSENLDISIENDMVVIKGKREKPAEKEKRSYFFQECYWGYFSREIVLPEEVDNSRAQASLKNGVLTIRMPKIERSKRRKIIIEQ